MSEVHDDEAANQYVITVDGEQAGVAHYEVVRGGRVFDHTEIDSAFEGKGLGSVLARGALDDVIERSIPFAASCPFIVRFLERHPDHGAAQDPSLLAS